MIYAKNENGIVKRYNVLSRRYFIGGVPMNLQTATIEIVNSQGFYELIVPEITVYQSLISLEPSDLQGNQYIQRVYDFTQAEIDAYDEQQAKQTVSQLLDKFESDGKAFFSEIRTLVQYHFNLGNIDQSQFENIKSILRPAIAPLLIGEYDQAKINMDAINRPSGELGQLYDFVIDGINDYLNGNG